ncbi:MAG: Ig-like domain-containing protein [Candidatus Nanopelagicales bacterium]|nr:Ig-like domain-containing protein [Candidatus Nanopelagicales bacterium]
MTTPRRLRGIGVRLAAAAALTLGMLGVAVAPSQALGGCILSGQSTTGVIGQAQVITTAGCSGPYIYANYANGAQDRAQIVGSGAVDQAVWTPAHLGVATLTDSDGSAAGTYTSTITQTQTISTISAPNTTQVGVPTTITVYVQSVSPSSYQPTGTVTIRDANNAVITTMGLTPGPGNGQAYAYWRWVAPSAGSFSFQATYSGDTYALVSQSPQDLIIASPSGSTISISAPSTVTTGVPVALTANVFPGSVQGSVGFTLNGAPISASVPIINGAAVYTWNPPTPGTFTLGANYMTNQGGSGSTSQPLSVIAGPTSRDTITLTQPGFGTWAPNGSYTLGQGTSVTFQASTLSGAPVTLTDVGPCTTSGLTLNVVGSSGSCTVMARSNGGNGYAAVTQNYTVTPGLGTQTAALSAPLSGRVNVKKVTVLQTPAQGTTNAGQNVVWSVANTSRSVCSLVFPANGAVHLRFKARGYCTVTASAPGITNQWSPFSLQRTYQGV